MGLMLITGSLTTLVRVVGFKHDVMHGILPDKNNPQESNISLK